MRSISQRELRNDSGAVMRAVRAGETLTVTVRGVPIATLAPVGSDPGPRIARPARTILDPAAVERVRIAQTTTELLDDLRGDR
ncbi:type II toxin-antitoxin system Phd/YefM family antitoxin [Demequina sp.]|uniref:type II toxin-antitoxin system Phd/YefM family antitoxin n=1 Tax=Demequina sp. TaxID=2050685 RepID=UPI003D0C32F4